MAKESEFVAIAQNAAEKILLSPLSVRRSAVLLTSRSLEGIDFGKGETYLFRTEVIVKEVGSEIT